MRNPFVQGRLVLPRADWIGWPILLGIAAFAWYASYCRHGDLLQDEGWQLDSALRILGGQLQHRDFHSIYPAGRHYLIAASLALFDESLLAVRLHWCLLDAVSVMLVLAIGRRLMPPGLALAAALTAVALPGPWHKVYYALIPLLVNLKTKTTLTALIDALTDADATVWQTCRNELCKIHPGGMEFGPPNSADQAARAAAGEKWRRWLAGYSAPP